MSNENIMRESQYIELLKKVLTDYHRMEFGEYRPLHLSITTWKLKLLAVFDKILRKWGYGICKFSSFIDTDRQEGKDWPAYADTMIGLKRLDNIEYCFHEIVRENIPGDLLEAGVWRGGATIFMKALLKEQNISDRIVWVADSFEGLPKPDEKKYLADKGDIRYTRKELAIPLETVRHNFRKYDLLDENVKFLKGWFKDTLPSAPIKSLSLLRLDGDLYESTMDGLVYLYPKLSVGGFVIIDDWGTVPGCKQAVIDYRKDNNINEEIKTIDWSGVYWRKEE